MVLAAGWLKMPFWPCLVYMALGKFARYLTMTWLLLEVPDGVWHRMLDWI
jgi:membrane protein YqaA with SNARE-associated domain